LFAAIIALITYARFVLGLDGLLAFWLAYVFTGPLGASFGDLLSQPLEHGGLALGTIATSLIFLACIAALVLYMTLSRDGEEIFGDAAE
jgi:uncharacterized membrane-anchored protein